MGEDRQPPGVMRNPRDPFGMRISVPLMRRAGFDTFPDVICRNSRHFAFSKAASMSRSTASLITGA